MTQDPTPRERLMTGKSWEEFCDAIKSAGRTILAEGSPVDPLDRAEGFRYLTRLTRTALEAFIEHADPAAPVLNRPVHETAKIGADNPDNYYQHANISGAFDYRIRGKRNTIHYLDFGTQSPGVASTGDSKQGGHLDAKDIEIGPDGRFEIILSSTPKPGNWLRMTPETSALIVRQTFLDRGEEIPAELVLERIGGEGRPRNVTPEAMDAGLKQAAGMIVGCTALFSNWAQGFRDKHCNQLPKFDDSISMGAGGDPNICYYHSYWQLGPEEALVIEVTPPQCESWNFQLDNHWMESLDYRYHTIHVNKHTAIYEQDGSVRIVVAHEDPGVPNWISTVGHSRGTMCFRWIRAAAHPQPRTRVVKRSELAGVAAGAAGTCALSTPSVARAGTFRVPPFPLPARLGLSAWRAATKLGVPAPRFDEDELVASAVRRTGLRDFGGEDFRTPLRRLLRAFDEEAELHLLGRAVLRSSVVRALECRLRLEEIRRVDPTLESTPVAAPVFVTGMQRTGTTKLHRLLACAPELRWLSSAEGLNPAPLGRPVRDEPGEPARRMAFAKRAERGMKYMSPALFAIHPIEADAPEEDVFLFDVTFISPAVDASLSVPSYTRWIREIDQHPPYAYVRRLIQLLLWQGKEGQGKDGQGKDGQGKEAQRAEGQRPGRYLGKTPHHQENLDVLFDVFPDAKVIHTHRDPLKVVPSFASMMAHAGAMLSRRVDPFEVGRRVADQMVNSVERAIVARAKVGEGRVLDVQYEDLVREPLRELRRVHDFAGLEWGPAAEERAKRWMAGNPQHKYGMHRYSLADFGLDEEELAARFKPYRERFGVAEDRSR